MLFVVVLLNAFLYSLTHSLSIVAVASYKFKEQQRLVMLARAQRKLTHKPRLQGMRQQKRSVSSQYYLLCMISIDIMRSILTVNVMFTL
jgi:hypothetical protein